MLMWIKNCSVNPDAPQSLTVGLQKFYTKWYGCKGLSYTDGFECPMTILRVIV